MSENIIYCYSGSGNCLNMAKEIAKNLGDTDIVLMRKAPEITDATAYKRVGFIAPCYGGGLPGGVEDHIKSIKIGEDAYKFGIIQYAGYAGCGLHKIDKIVDLDYWTGVSNHCSAIWLMPHYLTMPPTTLKGAQKRSDNAAKVIAHDVKRLIKSAKKPPKGLIFAIESKGMANINKKINAAMNVNDNCIGCGQCAKICPKGNIKIVDGKSTIGTDCIGCMACIEFCPNEAINVGKITVKRARFHNANVKAEDLTETVIHID